MPANRLSLARWLFAKDNTLTARVCVNRLWAKFFGVGLVKTTEDFGLQGEQPSHPELLDRLAVEYQTSGWDTKHMVRLMLNSRTYRQTAHCSPALLELDPENRLLGRFPRRRLPFWMIRDQALSVSGRLVRKVGGAPVNTYQPAGVWEEASFGKKKYDRGKDDDLYRRSLYTFWRRIAAPTMFFDNSDRMICSVKSSRTNTPLHALNTLNDVQFVEAARLMAVRILNQQTRETKWTDGQLVDRAFELALARSANQAESSLLVAAVARTRKQFAGRHEAANDLIHVGETAVDDSLDPVELATWTSLCLSVLNLDATLSVE